MPAKTLSLAAMLAFVFAGDHAFAADSPDQAAKRSNDRLELVLVLDNSGSMALGGLLEPLKETSSAFVQRMFRSRKEADDLHIGVVPFSQAVSIGLDGGRGARWTDVGETSRTGYPMFWTGCVEERRKSLGSSDTPPDVERPNTIFSAYYSPDTASVVAAGRQVNDWYETDVAGVTRFEIHYRGPAMADQQGPEAFCPQPMTPMTKTQRAVVDGLGRMTAQGTTFIDVGMVWAWRMLSPRWRGAWGSEMNADALPRDYDAKGARKAVVLVTDGANGITNGFYTAYGYLSQGRLGTTDRAEAEAALDARLATTCDSLKAKGVRVFTIAYDSFKDGRKRLEACASRPEDAFEARGPAGLPEAFDGVRRALAAR